jgi:hypothetical protein
VYYFYTLVLCSYRPTNSGSSLPPFVGHLTLGCGRDGHKTSVYFLSIEFNTVNSLVCSYILCNTTYTFTCFPLFFLMIVETYFEKVGHLSRVYTTVLQPYEASQIVKLTLSSRPMTTYDNIRQAYFRNL